MEFYKICQSVDSALRDEPAKHIGWRGRESLKLAVNSYLKRVGVRPGRGSELFRHGVES